MVSTDSPINGSATGPAGSGGAAPGSVYLAWQGACHFGWGIAGVQIALNWCRTRRFLPVLQSLEPEDLTLDPLRLRLLQPAIAASQQFAQKLAALPADAPSAIGMPVVFPLGNGAVIGAGELRGTRNIGRIVFENTQLDAAALARLRSLDALTVVSRWNRDLLAAQVDCPVVLNHEGIDPSVFFPGPRSGLADPSRFYIFSGGKVEYRKGHDLVLAAFRLFSAKHPEAMLVTAWQSPWPKMGAGLRGPAGAPLRLDASGQWLDIRRWAFENGVDPARIIDLGPMDNGMMPAVLREMDCAICASRAEGGTNFPIMEAMACGVPVIIPDNTGTRDLIEPGSSLVLSHQARVAAPPGVGTAGWGESAVEEIAAAFERLLVDSELRRALGLAGSRFMSQRTWALHASRLADLVSGQA